MDLFHTNIGMAHTILGFIALISGAIVIGRKKGTENHKRIGYLYFISMLLLNITALFTQVLHKFGPFHWLALGSLLGILIGISMPLFFRKCSFWLKQHYYFMLWSYVGLVAAFFAEIVVRLPVSVKSNFSLSFWYLVIATSVIIFIVGGYLIEKKVNSMCNNKTSELLI